MQSIKQFWCDETGLELSEYAVATALVSIPVALAFGSLSSKISSALNNLGNKMT